MTLEALIPIMIMMLFAIFVVWGIRRENIARARLQRLRPRNALFADAIYNTSNVCVTSPDNPKNRWHRAFLFVSNKQIVAYAKHGRDDMPLFACAPHQIEGFWRPTKYEYGTNLIEIHANIDDVWTIFQIRLDRTRMMALVRTLKKLVSEDMVRAYRQRRPYIYRDPAPAQRAQQNLQGAWELSPPFRLYLMPSALVFLHENDEVEHMIPLRYIQNIAALRRLDSQQGGLVRFSLNTTGEIIALALDDYEAWAQAIAAAARRTLEDPILRKQKKQQDHYNDLEELDDEYEPLDIPTTNMLEIGEWHDGEIIQWLPPESTTNHQVSNK